MSGGVDVQVVRWCFGAVEFIRDCGERCRYVL